MVFFFPVLCQKKSVVDHLVLAVGVLFKLKEDSQHLKAEVEQIALALDRTLEEIQDYLLYFSPVLAVCPDVVVGKDADGFKEELSAVEVILFCLLEHLLHDQLLGFEKLAISLFQPFGHVVKHLGKTFLEE